MSSLKYKDMEANFDKQLAKAESEAKSITVNKKPDENLSQTEQLLRIADVSPRAAFVEAWTLIEMAASKKGLKAGVALPRTAERFAYIILSIIPPVLVVVFLQRWFIQGLFQTK